MAVAKRRNGATPVLYQALGAAVLLGLWAAATNFHWVRPIFLPPLSAVWVAMREQWAQHILSADILTTVLEIAAAFLLSCVVGIPAGVLFGLWPRLHRTLEPLIWLFFSAPLVAFVSVLIILFGFGPASVIAMGVSAGVVYVVVNTVIGVRGVDRQLLNVASVYCRPGAARFFKVILPAALSTVATGVKLALGRVIVGVVIGEMFGGNVGLGARLVNAAQFFDTPVFYAAVLCLAIAAHMLTAAVGLVEKRVSRFR